MCDSVILFVDVIVACCFILCLIPFHTTIYISTFVSVPPDFGGLSVDSYISGILAGILEGAGFPARVTAHTVALEEGEDGAGSDRNEKTVFLVKFAASVLERDSQMNS